MTSKDRDKARLWAVTAACGAAAMLAMLALPGGHAAAGSQRTAPAAQSCPPGQSAAHCIKGTVIIWEDPAHHALNQLTQEDHSGAPQFSVGVGGASSWANPICVTNNPLTDKGRIMCPVLIGGAWANGQGRPVITLTGNDGVMPEIVLVQGGQRATLDFAQLQALDRWMAARGVR